jgi:hypothetical protein
MQTKKKAKLKNEIYLLIRNDIPLRGKIAKTVGIENDSVYRAAFRESPMFSRPFVLKIIIEHTGKTKEEILEK